eukprot:gi/632962896/ref/XP_007897576.1/ PREDICTED: uncharacterized protein C9orf40 homolog [Callorhinchus milii]
MALPSPVNPGGLAPLRRGENGHTHTHTRGVRDTGALQTDGCRRGRRGVFCGTISLGNGLFRPLWRRATETSPEPRGDLSPDPQPGAWTPPTRGLETPSPGSGDSQPGASTPLTRGLDTANPQPGRPPTRGLDTPNPGPGHRQPAAWRPLTRGLDTPNPGPGHRQPGAWTPPTRGLDTPNPGPGHPQPAAWRPPARGLDTPRSQPRPQPAAPAQNVELNDVPSAFNSFQFWRVPLPTINLDEIENPTLENAAEEMNCEETEEAAHVEMDVQN